MVVKRKWAQPKDDPMPIKKFEFVFEVNAEDIPKLARAVSIRVKGQQEPETVTTLPTSKPLALPAPLAGRTPPNGRMGSKAVILFYLAAHKRAVSKELKAALEEAGYSAKTYNGLIWNMKANKLISGSAQGYRILDKGSKMLDTVGDE
jgi:hypothetical protein